jgi:hypothetical protein
MATQTIEHRVADRLPSWLAMRSQVSDPRHWKPAWAPLVAAGAALVAVVAGLKGVDLAAAVYRVDLFHSSGFTLWDSQWYGGHWTLSYSVIFPPVAGVLGIATTEVACAATAALMFDRLVIGHFGRTARAGSLLFAVGTLAPVLIGQLPFLLGEALALTSVWAASAGRWRWAVAIAVAASLASPLAGAFLVLAALAWLLADWPRSRAPLCALAIAALVPIAGPALLFAGQGSMPFGAADFAWLLAVFAAALALVPAHERALRIGLILYLGAIIVSFVVSTPVGINVSRLGESLGAPLAACVLWRRSRWLIAAAVVPLAFLQWGPALPALSESSNPSTRAAYFQPLVSFLLAHGQPAARVEVVPTQWHWEAAYVAPRIALARGWERQLDTGDNPLFYGNPSLLTVRTYRAWLLENGVRFVALPNVALDYSGVAEARLLRAGVPGLRLAWHDVNWRVYQVIGAAGIVSGPARLLRLDGGHVAITATAAGSILVRVRYSRNWTVVTGQACLRPGADGWITVDAAQRGEVTLGLNLLAASPGPRCSRNPA